jgi:hypothetical protein
MNTVRSAITLAILAAFSVSPAMAASYSLSFVADPGSRWYDFYAGHFAQLDRTVAGTPPPNRLYSTDAESDPFAPTVYEDTGETAVVFAHGNAFANVGSLTYSGGGSGPAPVTGVTLDIASFVQSEEGSALGVTYTTSVTNVSGTITFSGGGASDIQVQADIRFEMDASFIPPLTTVPFDGTLVIHGNRFDIFVDDSYNFGHGELHHAWDLTGTIVGVGGGDTIFANGFDAG